MRSALAIVFTTLLATPLAGQRFVFGLAGAFGDYREVTNDLRYSVSGFGGSAVLTLGRFAAEASLTSLSYEPHESGTAAERFEATQFDGYLRYRVLRWASLELGATDRSVKEEFQFQAQSAAAWRIGIHSAAALGPYAGVAARASYLAGAKFSGGGSAPFGMDIGLSFHYGVARGRLRFTGESQFQHFGREVETPDGTRDVPIQQVTGRFGLAVAF